MRWLRDAATRIAERQAKDNLERYLRSRRLETSAAWVEAVTEARRRADVEIRLESRLEAMRGARAPLRRA